MGRNQKVFHDEASFIAAHPGVKPKRRSALPPIPDPNLAPPDQGMPMPDAAGGAPPMPDPAAGQG